MELSGKQRRYLRSLGHSLSPVSQIGRDGLSGSLVSSLEAALLARELVKIRIGSTCDTDRHEVAAELAARTSSALVQVLGSTVLLFRPNPDKPKISLPAGRN